MTMMAECAKLELQTVLDLIKIPYKTPIPHCGGWVIKFPWCDGDFACHECSYGGPDGLWESYKFPWDEGDVTGYLTIQDIVANLVPYYREMTSEGE